MSGGGGGCLFLSTIGRSAGGELWLEVLGVRQPLNRRKMTRATRKRHSANRILWFASFAANSTYRSKLKSEKQTATIAFIDRTVIPALFCDNLIRRRLERAEAGVEKA